MGGGKCYLSDFESGMVDGDRQGYRVSVYTITIHFDSVFFFNSRNCERHVMTLTYSWHKDKDGCGLWVKYSK